MTETYSLDNLTWDELVAIKRAVKCTLIGSAINDSAMNSLFEKIKKRIKEV